MIFEGIVTTLNPDGSPNVAPMGPDFGPEPDRFTLKPFKTSTTYRNLVRCREGVWHTIDDVLLIARSAIGLETLAETRPAARIEGLILVDCCRYSEFRIVEIDDRADRAILRAESVESGPGNRDWPGFNRARHAVVEAAIVATRADFLPIAEMLAEMVRLSIPVEKTGGDREREAFALLESHVKGSAIRRGREDGSEEAIRLLSWGRGGDLTADDADGRR